MTPENTDTPLMADCPSAPCSASFIAWVKSRGVWPRLTHEEIWNAAWTAATTPAKFDNVSCSQCGRDFGPGEHGFSHCSDHSPKGQCADCKWAQEKEDRYDQVRCCCDESLNAWGDVEASDSCSSFLPNDKSPCAGATEKYHE